MKEARRFFTLFVVLLLVSSAVFALPVLGKKSSKDSASESLVELPPEDTQEAQEVSQVEEQPVLSVISDETSTALSEALASLETASRLNKKQLDELIVQLEKAQEEYDVLVADIAAKEEERNTLTKLNQEQADAIARANGTKFFADAGVAMGFHEGFEVGVCADIGMRFGKSLMGKVGASYMLGTFDSIKSCNVDLINLDALTVNATIGWEW